MAIYKIFPQGLLNEDLALTEGAELDFNTYLVSVVFRQSEYCLLATLQYRTHEGSEWKIAASNVGDYDGEITIEIGNFNPENTLQLFWQIHAPLTKINALAIYLINKGTRKMVKVKPAEGVKVIEKGAHWSDEHLHLPLNF